MANKTIGALPAAPSSPNAGDLIEGERDPSGTPTSEKLTWTQVANGSAFTGKYQPIDSDLSAIAALTTTAFGRALLTLADQAALQTAVNVEDGADVTDATNVAAAGALMATTVDAKGDLLVGSADNAVARLSVGTNDYVLVADSSAPYGVKWAAAPSGATAANVSSVGGLIVVTYSSGWPSRPSVTGPVLWVNSTDDTPPTADVAGDLVLLNESA